MDELSKLTQRSEEQRRVLLDLQHRVAAAHQDLDSLRADSASAQVRTSVTGPIQVLLQAATAGCIVDQIHLLVPLCATEQPCSICLVMLAAAQVRLHLHCTTRPHGKDT